MRSTLNMKSFSIIIICLVILYFTNQLFAKEMTILVYPFQNTGSQQYSWLSYGMTASVISDLGKIKDITVISEIDRKKAIEEIQLSMTGLVDDKKAVKVGEVLGANIIFTGSYLVSKNQIRVNANLINVEKGNIEKTVKIDGTLDKIFDLQDKIVFSLLTETEKIQIRDIKPIKIAEEEKNNIKNSLRPNLNAYELYSKGLQLLNSNKYQESISYFNKAIELDSNYSSSYFNRGVAKGLLLNFQDQIADCNKVIELDSKNFAAYYNRGVAKSELKDYRGAIVDFNKAIELDSKYEIAYLTYVARGNAKEDLQEYQNAIADFDKSIKLNSNYAEAYCRRGFVKGQLGDYHGEISDLNKAIELNQQHAEAYSFRGWAKGELGDYYGEIADFTKVIELNLKDGKAYYCRGWAKLKLQNYQDAIDDLSKAIELNQKDVLAYSYYFRGFAKIQNRDKNNGCLDLSKAGELGYDKAYDAIKEFCK